MCVDTLLPYVGGGGGTISHATTALRGVDCIDTLLPELEGRSRKRAVVTLLPYGVRVRKHPTALYGRRFECRFLGTVPWFGLGLRQVGVNPKRGRLPFTYIRSFILL